MVELSSNPTGRRGHKMQVSILQRQNLALQTSLSCKKRELKDVQHELEQSTSRLRIRETAISVMDRQWMELEQQVARVLAQLNEPVPLPEVASSVLQQLVAPAPLAPISLSHRLSVVNGALKNPTERKNRQFLGSCASDQAADGTIRKRARTWAMLRRWPSRPRRRFCC